MFAFLLPWETLPSFSCMGVVVFLWFVVLLVRLQPLALLKVCNLYCSLLWLLIRPISLILLTFLRLPLPSLCWVSPPPHPLVSLFLLPLSITGSLFLPCWRSKGLALSCWRPFSLKRSLLKVKRNENFLSLVMF